MSWSAFSFSCFQGQQKAKAERQASEEGQVGDLPNCKATVLGDNKSKPQSLFVKFLTLIALFLRALLGNDNR